MQLQRIQTLYIFLAFVAMMLFVIVPCGTLVKLDDVSVAPTPIYTMENPGILIPVGATVLLLIVDLFFYRNLSLQKLVLTVCLMLTLACIAVLCFLLYREAQAEGFDTHFSPWDVCLLVAVMFEILALGGICRDQKLLSSYNRLR